MSATLLLLFEIYRLALRVLVLFIGWHFFSGTITYLRHRKPPPDPEPPSEWPLVTVQLPVRNEFYLARRVLEAVARFDYPRDKLQIQVLDDSDDATSDDLADAVRRLKASGVDVEHIQRDEPAGYKAGALQHGLLTARGEFVAIFDADFIPQADFLRRTVPHFGDERVALVQGRWEHLNRGFNWFTRLQAQILDGMFAIEQTAKSRVEAAFQFNGTAGIWRRTAVDQAGGWSFDSLTEDFDLSMRVQFAGWRFVHLPEVTVPSELPTSLGVFRVQQRRWALGSAQLLRKRLWDVLGAPLSIISRLGILAQLCRHFAHPLLLLMVFSVPATTFVWVEPMLDYGLINAAVIGFTACGIMFRHVVAAIETKRSVVEAIILAPLVIPLTIGLAPTYTIALGYGLRDRAGAFHRTPKVHRALKPGEPDYRAKRSVLVFVELSIAAAYAYFTILAVRSDLLLGAAFMALVCFSYLWVGLGSLGVRTEGRSEAAVDPVRTGSIHET